VIMQSKKNIDIVIPSYRLEEKYIIPLIDLPKPEGWSFNYFIVVDNPAVKISPQIESYAATGLVTLLINPYNLGASFSRNRGMEAGTGQWVLFLDDDIRAKNELLFHYVNAIDRYPEEIGFIGLVKLPPPPTAFAKALLMNGSMMIFGIAEKTPSFSWGATANMMVKRSAVGDIRFSEKYPKFGGGEDVDFFLSVRDKNQCGDYRTLKEAVVCHPWWKEGKPDFVRHFRYGEGNSYLAAFNPQYAYYDFPNTPETLFLMVVVLPVAAIASSSGLVVWITVFGWVVVAEAIATWIQLAKRHASVTVPILYYVLRLKFAYSTGMLMANLRRGRLKGIGERFEFKGQHHRNGFFQFNTYKIVKWVLYIFVLLLLGYLCLR